MVSTIVAVACPHCNRSALADERHKTNEINITCFRCGYNYAKRIQARTNDSIQYKEDTYGGYGVFKLVDKTGKTILGQFRSPMKEEQFNDFKEDYFNEEFNQKESFLVTYDEGQFTVYYGEPSENFFYSFDQYKEKMMEKYGAGEMSQVSIPFEE